MATCLREATYFTFPHIRQEKLVVFHVEKGNVLSLSAATDHRVVRLLLSGWLCVFFGWDLKVNLMHNSLPVLFLSKSKTSTSFYIMTIGQQSQKREGRSHIQHVIAAEDASASTDVQSTDVTA